MKVRQTPQQRQQEMRSADEAAILATILGIVAFFLAIVLPSIAVIPGAVGAICFAYGVYRTVLVPGPSDGR